MGAFFASTVSAAVPHELNGVRLLLVGDWPPPIGGVAIHLRALRDAARKIGADARVIDIGHGQNRLDGVVPSGRPRQFVDLLMSEARQADIVHLHTSGANPKSWIVTGLVGAIARLSGASPVVTFHSGHGPIYLQRHARKLAARAALLAYDTVIGVNAQISRTLGALNPPESRHAIAPAFGLEGLQPKTLPPEIANSIHGRSPVISAMLAPGDDYGAPELLAAFSHFRQTSPDALLIVFGADTAALRGDNVLGLGPVERDVALGIMRASDLFVRPTRVDGDAVSVREALALGRRVVATRVGNRPGGVTLCAPNDPNDLLRAMREALDGPPSIESAPEDGIEQVLRIYARVSRPTARSHAA